MKLSKTKLALSAALALAIIGGPALVAVAQSDAVKARKDNRKEILAAVLAVNAVVKEKGDPKAVTPHANKMVDLSKAYEGMFPAGSDSGGTRALPSIWANWNDFLAVSKNFQDEAAKLSQVSASGDIAAVGQQLRIVGAACDTCHDKYRAK